MPDDSLRLFFALPCPAELASALCQWRDALALGGKEVPAESLHLTLAFLGQQPRSRLPLLERIAADISAPPLRIPLDSPFVLRHGLFGLAPQRPPAALLQLAADLHTALREAGIPVEPRRFRPHLTLVRHAALQPAQVDASFCLEAQRFALYASQDGPRGVYYRALASWPLEGVEPPAWAARLGLR
ncbi:RNA 2',3'-cyclic phosphodiesterase [Pseudomonas sp. NW5]|uniref:RNA 2',3'-cyclic phosphodiesterase n=1 Tax=Pseudomonas sp. NW5 TaxID=2934934 RepID=UPI002020A4F2|nr:RNA 2',3'-cyclic phosphodiesterase [Pseudomonas sp. NW5]MCL7462831.1 RNA 2',3'-cyclic phosphodiesterase [Pseudomonas sp. NW5]